MWSRHSSELHSGGRRRAFSLLEMLVSFAVISLLVVILASITGQTGSIWRKTTGDAEQFRAAREGFEAMVRRIEQATLNTYWDYDYPAAPRRYERQSELRFLSGPMARIASGGKAWETHGIFFQIPGGFVGANPAPDADGLENLLNTVGFYVEFGDDSSWRPSFVEGPARYRYRLMEMLQPTEQMGDLFQRTSGNRTYDGREWFNDALSSSRPPAHVVAENVIALVVAPRLSFQDDSGGVRLAPDFVYDSTSRKADAQLNPRHQLPPVVDLTMVAIDETGAARLAEGSSPPGFPLDGLFKNAANLDADLRDLQDWLTERNINHRVFTASVAVPAARWSREQSN